MASSQSPQGITAGKSTPNRQTTPGSTKKMTPSQDTFESSPATGLTSPNFEDCDFFSDAETNAHKLDYTDFILYNFDTPPHDTASFFADLDTSTKANHGSTYNGENNESAVQMGEGTVFDAEDDLIRRSIYFHPIEEMVRAEVNDSVYEAISQYEIRSKSEYSTLNYDDSILNPLQKWEGTYERHESIAYRLERPSQAAGSN